MRPELPATGRLKRLAAERASELVESGMVLGLGTGSTAALAVAAIGRRLEQGTLADVRGVPTSPRTRELARAARIPLTDLEQSPRLDLTIDGADEVAPDFGLIKGRGGALLREKIVAWATRRNVIVVDETKLVDRLGRRSSLPVEVVRFGWSTHVAALERLGAEVTLRRAGDGEPYLTEEGHFLLDCRFAEAIGDAAGLEREIRARPGVVETGLFLGLATTLVVGGESGVRVLERDRAGSSAGRGDRR